jgi:hypothetical protein
VKTFFSIENFQNYNSSKEFVLLHSLTKNTTFIEQFLKNFKRAHKSNCIYENIISIFQFC